MKYVLDTTALFNAKDFPLDFEIIIPQGVLNELMAWGLSDRIKILLGVRIHIQSASDASRRKVKEAAEVTGDIDRLSPTDIEVLSLAVELGVPLISDDYSIQNVSNRMGIQHIPMEQRGIRKVFFWKYRCAGCGKEYERDIGECTVCGHKLKSFKYRSEEKS